MGDLQNIFFYKIEPCVIAAFNFTAFRSITAMQHLLIPETQYLLMKIYPTYFNVFVKLTKLIEKMYYWP